MVLREEKKKVRVPPLVVKQSVNGKREWLSNDLQRIKLLLQNGRWTFLWAAAAGNHGRAVTRQWIRTTTKSMSLVTRRHRPREQPTSTFRDAPPVHRPAFIRSLIATRSLCLINPNNPFNVLNIAETKWRKDDVDDDDDDGDVCRARKMEDPSRSRRDDCSRKITIRVCRLSRILTCVGSIHCSSCCAIAVFPKLSFQTNPFITRNSGISKKQVRFFLQILLS